MFSLLFCIKKRFEYRERSEQNFFFFKRVIWNHLNYWFKSMFRQFTKIRQNKSCSIYKTLLVLIWFSFFVCVNDGAAKEKNTFELDRLHTKPLMNWVENSWFVLGHRIMTGSIQLKCGYLWLNHISGFIHVTLFNIFPHTQLFSLTSFN